MRDSVPSASYSSICNVLRQWSIWFIPTDRLYDIYFVGLTQYIYVIEIHGIEKENMYCKSGNVIVNGPLMLTKFNVVTRIVIVSTMLMKSTEVHTLRTI